MVGSVPTAASAGDMARGFVVCAGYEDGTCPPRYPSDEAGGRAINHALAVRLAAMPGVDLVNLEDVLCAALRHVVDGRELLYADDAHLYRRRGAPASWPAWGSAIRPRTGRQRGRDAQYHPPQISPGPDLDHLQIHSPRVLDPVRRPSE